jgi:hypothetical protein
MLTVEFCPFRKFILRRSAFERGGSQEEFALEGLFKNELFADRKGEEKV